MIRTGSLGFGVVCPRSRKCLKRSGQIEGVYAINPALFVVITEDAVYHLHHLLDHREAQAVTGWHQKLKEAGGFRPLIVGLPVTAADPIHPDKAMSVDSIGIVTIHDGPSLAPGEIIAPAVGNDPERGDYHNNYQDTEKFLSAGGRRGRQYVPLTDGTYFLNRWFATIEMISKTVVPIGYVGVVVSYHGRIGRDLFGTAVTVVGINDLWDAGTLAHLLQYDSTFGRLNHRVDHDDIALRDAHDVERLRRRGGRRHKRAAIAKDRGQQVTAVLVGIHDQRVDADE